MMPTTPLKPHRFRSLAESSPREVLALLASARTFKQAGQGARPLRGRHAAVLSESPGDASAEVFAAAAAALGATVVRIPPSKVGLGDERGAEEAARLLGQLYCAVGYDGASPAVSALLSRWAGVPVFDAVAGQTHPTRLFGDLLTMSEHLHKPLAEITLCVTGDPLAPLALAWQRLARLTGIRVCTGPCTAEAAAREHSDFVCAGDAPALWALDPDGGPPRPLSARQGENHRCIVQALLSDTLG
jgi:ornithine carbamoyltransferase